MSGVADSGPGGPPRKARRPRAAASAKAPIPEAPPQSAPPQPDATWPAFWLPAALRGRLITADTRWQEARFARGRECGTDCPDDQTGGVAVRWPLFDDAQWDELASGLRAARARAPRGLEYWTRLQAALAAVAVRLADPGDSCHQTLLEAVPGYTGYSRGMVAGAFGATGGAAGAPSAPGAPGLWDLEQMAAALHYRPDKVCSARWRKLPGLPGKVRFFPSAPLDKAAGWTPVAWEMPLYRAEARPDMVVGYASGNIPGNALPIVILALSATLRGEAPLPGPEPPPAVLVGNSMEEPILTPLVLAAIEEVDPELVSMVAALVLDHGDEPLQKRLLEEADLVIAAAGDDVIAGLSRRMGSLSHVSSNRLLKSDASPSGCDGHVREKDAGSANSSAIGATEDTVSRRSVRSDGRCFAFQQPPKPRLHAHGHKVSFSVIGREMQEVESAIDIVALLAGLDSAFWDQNSCLSSRVHFVERGGPADDLPAEYARCLTARLRQIAQVMPRGAWPLHLLHDPFDRYKAIEGSDRWGTGLRVMSDYDDTFVVVLDERTGKESRLDRSGFASVVDECQTRVIMVRPVEDLMEVPRHYLRMMPAHSLQSLGVAVGRPGEGLTRQFLEFAGACGKQGVTAIRTVGKAAFPQTAYSWDGFLPVDLVGYRPPGYFTTIEFDSPFEEMMDTYRAHLHRLAHIPAEGARPAGRRPTATALTASPTTPG